MREQRITEWLAETAIRKRKRVYVVFGALILASLMLSPRLGLVVEPEQLLGEDNAIAQQFFALEESFGFTSTLVVAVEGEDREQMLQAAHMVVDRVEADPELRAYFRSVSLAGEVEYPLRWGLMLTNDLGDIETTQLLTEQRSMLGLLTTLNNTLEDVVLSDEERFASNQDQWNGLAALSGFELLTQTMERHLSAEGELQPDEARLAAQEIMESALAGDRYTWSPDQDMLTFSFLPAFDMLDLDALYAAVHGVDSVMQQVDRETPGVKLSLGGEVAWAVARHEGAGADTLYPTLVALALIAVLFFFSFNRVRRMLLALLALVIGIILTVGAIVISVGHVSMITSIFAVILMGLGIDFGIHLVSNYDDFRSEGLGTDDAMRKTMITGGTPIMLGGITTACAFLSLVISRSPAIREFGIVAGMGVLITLFTMLLLFPALILSFGGKTEPSITRRRPMIDFSFMGSLGRAIQARPLVAIGLCVALTALAAIMLPRNTVDYDPMNNSPRTHRYTETQRRIIDRMEISPFVTFSTRTTVEEARELTEAFRAHPMVSRAVSVSDLLPPQSQIDARLSRISAGGPAGFLAADDIAGYENSERSVADIERLTAEIQRLEWNVIEFGDLAVAGMGEDNLVVRRRNAIVREIFGAEVGSPGREVFQTAIATILANPEAAAQRMAAIDKELAGVMETQQRNMSVTRAPTVADIPPEIRHQLVSRDGNSFLVTVLPSAAIQESSETVLAFQNSVTEIDPGLTGSLPLYVALVHEIFSGATQAGVYVAAVVFVILFVLFRRISHVLLAFTMVVLGLVWMFGILPLTGTQLALTAGLVFPLLIGIGTDDALHILHRYKHEGNDIVPAIRYSGKAVLLTTLTTMLAFGSLALVGEMATIAAIGWLLLIGFGTCFLATVVLLPACLSLGQSIRRKNGEKAAKRGAALVAGIAVLMLLPSLPVDAQTMAPEAIMREVDAQRGPETARSRMTMRIYPRIDAANHDREIRLNSFSRGINESLIEFVSPRSITGLRVLDLDGAVRVFFPSTGRVRNIGGSGRGGSVGGVGGDFSYEDMGGGAFLDDYHQFALEGQNAEHWIVSAVPLDGDSRYSRLVFHIQRENYVPVRIDYFEGDNQSKRLEASRIQAIGGRNVATHLIMFNLQDNSRTEIRMHEVEWDVPLSTDLFHPNRFHR